MTQDETDKKMHRQQQTTMSGHQKRLKEERLQVNQKVNNNTHRMGIFFLTKYGFSLITGMILCTGLGTGTGTYLTTGTTYGFGTFTGTGTGYGFATGTDFGT